MGDPSRSPNCSQGSPASEDHRDEQSHLGSSSSVREQDRFLPIANIGRIMKRALPANAKISKEAKDTVQECVSEFISFITSEASDKCQREKRKTINGDDLLWAMGTLGFEEYVEPLRVYLQRFRELEGDGKGIMSNKTGSETMYNKEGIGHFEAQGGQDGQSLGYYNAMAYYQPQMQQLITSQGRRPL